MDSKIGTIIQFSGVFLIAVLCLFLTRSLESKALDYWKKAWVALSLSLLSLFIAFNSVSNAKPLFLLYYLGEYAFGYFLVAGCRNYASDNKITAQSWWWMIPGFLLAVFLSFSTADFNNVFNLHSFVIATIFAVAFFALKPAGALYKDNFGWHLMRVALALLAIDFYHYTLLFSLPRYFYQIQFFKQYLTFEPVIDLVLEILLGFGMVIVLLERVRRETEDANSKLKKAHDKLEELAHIDPLTTAFTRHAFYGFLNKRGKDSSVIFGCVGVFDIDNLKPINDRFGHFTGDMAIRAVVRSIRVLIRAEDLLFRWGGDEFFVIMISTDSEMARERMSELARLLGEVKIDGLDESLRVGVSYGFADFSGVSELEQAVKNADAEMYRVKQARKVSEKSPDAIFASMPKKSAETSLTLK